MFAQRQLLQRLQHAVLVNGLDHLTHGPTPPVRHPKFMVADDSPASKPSRRHSLNPPAPWPETIRESPTAAPSSPASPRRGDSGRRSRGPPSPRRTSIRDSGPGMRERLDPRQIQLVPLEDHHRVGQRAGPMLHLEQHGRAVVAGPAAKRDRRSRRIAWCWRDCPRCSRPARPARSGRRLAGWRWPPRRASRRPTGRRSTCW